MTLGVLGDHLVISQDLCSQCDDSGHHSRKHPVMLLSSRYSTPGFEPEIHPTYFMLIVIASSFRILVTLR